MVCPCLSPLDDHQRGEHPECWFTPGNKLSGPLTQEEINGMYPGDPRCGVASACWIASELEYGRRVNIMAAAFQAELQRAWKAAAELRRQAAPPAVRMVIPADGPARLAVALSCDTTTATAVNWDDVRAVVALVNSWRTTVDPIPEHEPHPTPR